MLAMESIFCSRRSLRVSHLIWNAELMFALSCCAGRGRNFSVGGDIRTFVEAGDTVARQIRDIISNFHDAMLSLRRSAKPSIAVVHGACAGGAMSLALGCDFVVADSAANFAIAYRRLAATADGGMTHTLTRILGQRRTLDLMLVSDRISAEEALRLGLINRVALTDDLEREVPALADTLRRNGPISTAAVKALIYDSPIASMERQLSSELEAFARCAATADFQEGLQAFLARRSPNFEGR
jgi:2-(1,2-epoxy-1,2-dihydrophenyl)acetyl-CoA isomerase